MPETMRTWQLTGPGPLDKKLRLVEDAVCPQAADLQPGQVLAKVVSAALNPADYKLPEMGMATRAVVGFPKTPGMDMAGTIEAVGPEVGGDIKQGDAIMARLDPMKSQGALAEYVVLDEGTWVTASGVDMNEAAGAVTVALTAYQCIKPYVKEGDKVFLNGGGGGLGTAGIQIAKLLGCHVTVSCSGEKAQFCKDLGADEVIDYKQTNVTAELAKQGADKALIVDNVGNSPTDLYRRSDQILVPTGAYVYVGGRMSAGTILNLSSSLMRPSWLGGQSRRFVMIITKTVEQDLKQIASWMVDGKLKTVLDSTFGFEEAKEAYDKLKTDRCRGKVIVRVTGEKEV
jgi:NADPH:quinone reductase-like Zn-dependent oxidoreductase